MKNRKWNTDFEESMVSFDNIRKSLIPLSETLTAMAIDTTSFTGTLEIIRSQIMDICNFYKPVDFSKSISTIVEAVHKSLEIDNYKVSLDALEMISSQFSAMNSIEEYREGITNIEAIAKSIISIGTIDTSFAAKNIAESMKNLTANIASDQIKQLETTDYSNIFPDIIISSDSLKEAADKAYAAVRKDDIQEETELEIDFADEKEIQDAINDQINNPVGFQERFGKWATQKIAKYFIIWRLICFLWTNFAQPYFQEYVGVPVMANVVSNVKELPQRGAQIVCQLKENVEAIIVENTNYYYKVSFTDEEGVQREGYVAKRNLKLVEESCTAETEETSLTKQ